MKDNNNITTAEKDKKMQKQKLILNSISLFLALVLVCSTLTALFMINRNSVAYLYDEANAKVDYSVAKLSFDVSSDHMYSYYSANPTYSDTFETMLKNINQDVSDFDSNTMTKESFESDVISQFKNYYDASMISSLDSAFNSATSQENYDEKTQTIYNKYYDKYEFLFKIKSVQLESVDDTKGIWYYYANDLLETYLKKYVVQNKANGVRQSTVKIGVKLKGGTTYNNDESQLYYDNDFNDMVCAYTIRLNNTGNVSFYTNIDMNFGDANNQKGILGMVLPYGMTWDTLMDNEEYSSFYNTSTKVWNYRGLIRKIIGSNESVFTSTLVSTNESDRFGSLTYSSMENVLNEWNQYALSTYESNSDVNSNGNFIVKPADNSTESGLENIKVSMMFWADYETIRNYYYNNTNELEWKSDDKYMLIPYNYSLDIKTSLKNNDLSSLTPEDWEELYNSKETIDKFVGVSNFDAEGYAYFEYKNSSNETVVDNAKNHMQSGYILCDYVNEDAENYIGNLRLDVKYRGYSPAYVRVRFVEQFTNNKNEIEAVNPIKFSLDNTWKDNRINDLYFYSAKQFSSSDTNTITMSGKAKLLTVPVIKGLDSSIKDASDIDSYLDKNKNLTLRVFIQVEAVQPNRIDEYWSISKTDIENMN